MKKTLSCILMLAALVALGSCGKKEAKETKTEAAVPAALVVKGVKCTNSIYADEAKYVNLEESDYTVTFAEDPEHADKYKITVNLKVNVNPADEDASVSYISFDLLDKNEEDCGGVDLRTNSRAERLITEALQGSEPKVVEVELEGTVAKGDAANLTANAQYISIDVLSLIGLPSEESEKVVETVSTTVPSTSVPDFEDAYNSAVKDYQDAYNSAVKEYQDAYNDAKRQMGL